MRPRQSSCGLLALTRRICCTRLECLSSVRHPSLGLMSGNAYITAVVSFALQKGPEGARARLLFFVHLLSSGPPGQNFYASNWLFSVPWPGGWRAWIRTGNERCCALIPGVDTIASCFLSVAPAIS